jgi:hypothetical protein
MNHKDKPDGQLMAEMLALLVRNEQSAFMRLFIWNGRNTGLVHAVIDRAKPWIEAMTAEELAKYTTPLTLTDAQDMVNAAFKEMHDTKIELDHTKRSLALVQKQLADILSATSRVTAQQKRSKQ